MHRSKVGSKTFLLYTVIVSSMSRPPASSVDPGHSKFQTTVEIALETLKVAKEIAPDPAKGALAAVTGVLSLLQVSAFLLFYQIMFLSDIP